jgi:hypothetical protein
MKGHGEKLSRNQEKAIAALISHNSIPAAAESIGIGEVTLWRWLKVEHFKAAYREARCQVVSQAIGRLQTNLSKAIDTLLEIAEDGEAPASARVTAARAIIDQSLKAVEVEDLETRVEQLEQIIKEKLSCKN